MCHARGQPELAHKGEKFSSRDRFSSLLKGTHQTRALFGKVHLIQYLWLQGGGPLTSPFAAQYTWQKHQHFWFPSAIESALLPYITHADLANYRWAILCIMNPKTFFLVDILLYSEICSMNRTGHQSRQLKEGHSISTQAGHSSTTGSYKLSRMALAKSDRVAKKYFIPEISIISTLRAAREASSI